MDNPCLRPACLSDVRVDWIHRPFKPHWHGGTWLSGGMEYNAEQHGALQALYDAEWRKRRFAQSP